MVVELVEPKENPEKITCIISDGINFQSGSAFRLGHHNGNLSFTGTIILTLSSNCIKITVLVPYSNKTWGSEEKSKDKKNIVEQPGIRISAKVVYFCEFRGVRIRIQCGN